MKTAQLPTLTKSNYYSQEANLAYMSVSQFKNFAKCEAAALAEVRGEFERKPTPAMLFGSYVDSYFEGTLSDFRQEHPELFVRDGGLKAEYRRAEEVIRRIESDRMFSLLMAGEKQRIITGNIAGVPFKGKIDSYLTAKQCLTVAREFPATSELFDEFCEGAIVDLKVMSDFEDVWSDAEWSRVDFITAWRYDLQGGVYQALEGRGLPFIIAAASKQNPPDITARHIPQHALTSALHEVEDAAPRYAAIKAGKIDPQSCENCEYCRKNRKLTVIFSNC